MAGKKQLWGTLLLLLGWGAVVALMIEDWHSDPYDPALRGIDAYGHNGQGALPSGVLFVTIEVAVLYAILRPLSYDRSWQRALYALGLVTPWTLISALAAQHAGGVFALHIFWLCTVWIALAVLSLVSGAAAFLAYRRRAPANRSAGGLQ